MTRSDLIALLEAHEPFDTKERSDRELMLRLARELERPFSADEETAHFTASALVLDESRSSVCLVHHRKLDRWLQPGGHVEEGDASMLAAAQREVVEETGLEVRPVKEQLHDVDVHEFPARGGRAAHLHLDCRFLFAAATPEIRASEESLAVSWFTLERASAIVDAGLRRMIEKL